MKKNIASILFPALLGMAVCACSGGQQLKGLAEEMNRACPVPMEGTGTIDKATYEDNTFTLHCTVDAAQVDIDQIKANEQAVHDATLQAYAGNDSENFREIVETLVSADASLEVVYNSTDGKSHTFHFTAEELKHAIDN